MKNYWIKKIDKDGKIIWRPGRSLGLEGAKGRIGNIANYVKQILKKKKKIRILEIGTGFGRALLELKRNFGSKVEVFGTNYEKEWNQKLTNEYALNQGFKKKEIPKIYNNFDTGKKLPFKFSSFDFIFCQATMQYIRGRALFIEEVNRILTNQGLAILELQEFRSDHPKKYEDLIEILEGKKKIDFLDYLKKFKNIKIRKSIGRDWHYLIIKKSNDFSLNLRIKKSINLEKISSKYWGLKVIYEIKKSSIKVQTKKNRNLTKSEKSTINKARVKEFGKDNFMDFKKHYEPDTLWFFVKQGKKIVSIGGLRPVKIEYQGRDYNIKGICSIISIKRNKGYGTILIHSIIDYLKKTGKTALGFTKQTKFFKKAGLGTKKDFVKKFIYVKPNKEKVYDNEGDGIYYNGKDKFISDVLKKRKPVFINILQW